MTGFGELLVSGFLAFIGYLLHEDKCPPLENVGGYPKCNDYHSKVYDYIIVGGGPAGSTLANRLSENPNVTVLLIEAGEYPSLLSEIPAEFIFLQRTRFDYNYTMQQPGMFQAYKNEAARLTQGHVLGGGSAINVMLAVPGVPDDYNRWAELVQDPEWAYENLIPYFEKVYSTVAMTNYTAYRLARLNIGIAARKLGYSVNNPKDIFGYHEVPIMVDDDLRNSIARAYLVPIENRTNLCVVVGKQVTKIRIDPTTKVAMGVEVLDKRKKIYIEAKREVIVSGGAIGSPKLLMLSGIGPKTFLKTVGIDAIVDLPVGRLRDHIYVPIIAQTPSIAGLYTHEEYIEAYCDFGFPMKNVDLTNFVGYINTEGDKSHPNIEIIHAEFPKNDQVFQPQAAKVLGYNDKFVEEFTEANKNHGLFLFNIAHLHPISQGAVLLSSSDPKDPPLIRPNFLNDPNDIKVFVDAILQVVIPMLETFPFRFTKLIRFDFPKCDSIPINGTYYKSREYWECYLRYLLTSELHPIATCRMGTNSTESVVDSHFRVWGIRNLRVVDTSAIPKTISGHNTVPVTMMSEKAADIILKDNGLK